MNPFGQLNGDAMRFTLMLVVSMLMFTLFPLSASATTYKNEEGKTMVAPPVNKSEDKPALAGIAVLIVQLRREGVPETDANDIARQMATAMEKAGINIKFGAEDGARKLKEYEISDPAFCKGNPKCVAMLGSKLNVASVVAMQFDALDKTLTIHTEVVSTADKVVGLSHDISVLKADPKAGITNGLNEFAQKMKDWLNKRSPPPAVATAKNPGVDAPVAPATPVVTDKPKAEPKKDPPALVIKPPREFQAPPPDVVTKAPPSHTARYIGIGSGIAGVAAIGVGAYFGLQVLDDKSKAEKTTSLEEFNSLRAGAKGKIQTADILYGVGGGLLATGVVLIVVDTAMTSNPTPAKSVSIAVLPSGGISVAGTW